jgi:hypothetical protein
MTVSGILLLSVLSVSIREWMVWVVAMVGERGGGNDVYRGLRIGTRPKRGTKCRVGYAVDKKNGHWKKRKLTQYTDIYRRIMITDGKLIRNN